TSSRSSSTPRKAPISAFRSIATSRPSAPARAPPRPSPPSRVFEVIPAIDLRDGRCVQLAQGDFARSTVFGDDPPAMGRRWAAAGATRIHVVDLDGSRAGAPVHLPTIQQIAAAV